MKRANDKAGTEISVPAFSVLKKPRRVRRPQAANRIKSFSAATPSAILAAQPLRPTLKICRRHIFKRCGVAENTSHSASVEFVCFRQTNYARSRVQPFRKSGRSHFFENKRPDNPSGRLGRWPIFVISPGRPSEPPPGRSSPRTRPGPPGPCGRRPPACGRWACAGPDPG